MLQLVPQRARAAPQSPAAARVAQPEGVAQAVVLAATPNPAAAPRPARLTRAARTTVAALPVRALLEPVDAPPAETMPCAAAPMPVYRTRAPAPASLYFVLQRGARSGSAELHWQHAGGDYELRLDGMLHGGSAVLGSISRGRIDADGVAPLRYADRRRSREVRAANFRREVGLISFSGPSVEYPLTAGAQDRLSWMTQLPAIFEAEPTLPRVSLFVVGTRGDAQAWHFEVQGRATLELPAGLLENTVHLLRQPNHPYDTRVEVWLDPARQHLPVRATFTTVPGGEPLDMQLSRSSPAAPLEKRADAPN
jgi:hypothetical protein